VVVQTEPLKLGLCVNGREFQTSSYTFEFYHPVSLLSIAPINGPKSGGRAVRLSGENFVNSDNIV
jgi:hypothetical protein